jgi:hypothetical protein
MMKSNDSGGEDDDYDDGGGDIDYDDDNENAAAAAATAAAAAAAAAAAHEDDAYTPSTTSRHLKLPPTPGTIKALDSIRSNRNKFICLNDNLGENDVFMHGFLANFYEALLPQPSPFELPRDQSNVYLRWAVLDLGRVACDV